MLNIKHILLARDESTEADEVLPFALWLAERTGAKLHVVFAEVLHGERLDQEEDPTAGTTGMRERTNEVLEKYAPLSFDPSGIEMEHAIVRGVAPAPALLSYVGEHAIDLVMMGTHGRRGVRRLLMGSVAEEIVRFSPCPVLVVHPGERERKAHLDAILVPIDFSEHSRDALRHAKALGKLLGVRLDLLHVVEENLHPAFYGPTVQSVYDIDPDLDEKLLSKLKTFYQHTEGPGTEVTFAVRSGHAVQEILQFAEWEDSDLIVMGTHGLTGLERFLLGSVTENVMRRAPCSVFTLKSFGKLLASSGNVLSTSSEASMASAEG